MPDSLAAIHEAAEALCDPHQHSEPRWEWDHNRHRKPLNPHKVTLPGLIQQLREMAEPGSGEEGTAAKSIAESRPPVTLDAVSLLAAIEFGAARRCIELGLTNRGTAESNIRAVAAEAARVDSDRQRVLASELRSWHNQAEVVTRWRNGAVELVAPCPAADEHGHVCNARGTLLANPETHAAWCVACGHQWAPEDADSLFAHVRTYAGRSKAAAEEVRAEVRARKAAAREAEERAREERNGGRDAA